MDKERKDKIMAFLYGAIVLIVCLSIAVLVRKCGHRDERDQSYDEYLEEVYDGAERYDPM